MRDTNAENLERLKTLRYHAERHTFNCGHPLEGVLESAVERIDRLELEIELFEGDRDE